VVTTAATAAAATAAAGAAATEAAAGAAATEADETWTPRTPLTGRAAAGYHTDRQPGERRTLRYERCKVAVCGLSGRSRAAMSGTWRLTAN
jgi:hypothetical protein